MSEELTEPGKKEIALSVRNLSKKYGNTFAVNDISLDVLRNEFLTLLGPSGSGKTTTLRMIAGFSDPTSGEIELYKKNITFTPPEKREIGMVFQNYALFPHMTAGENIAFPLQMRKLSKTEIQKKVEESLALVRLSGFGDRYPRQLSGGQQQRIAIARAVTFQPRILLMDEPLGALDKKLREDLQVEILDIRRRINATVIYVTHDQEEALAMSNRIAVFNNGRIEQLGSSNDLYESPSNLFIARFMGESTIIIGTMNKDQEGYYLDSKVGMLRIANIEMNRKSILPGQKAALVLRPERIKILSKKENLDSTEVSAKITEVRYLGSTRKYNLELIDGTEAVVREITNGESEQRSIGDFVNLSWNKNQAVLLPA